MTRAEVLVVEARQYEHSGARIIVPVLIGYSDEIRKIKETVVIRPASDRPLWTKDRLIESVKERAADEATIVESLTEELDELGLVTRGLPSGVNYGIEIGQHFIALVTLLHDRFYLNVTKNGYSRLSSEWFTRWKRSLDGVVHCYKEDALSEASNKGALMPRYGLLSGKVDAFTKEISAIKAEIERAFARAE
jgi:hypothetical protein